MKGLASHSDTPDMASRKNVVSNHIQNRHFILEVDVSIAHTHFRNGTPFSANMVEYKCEAKRIIYTSLDIAKPITIVMFEGRHSHPPWPAEKVTHEAKDDLQKCLDAFGIYGATAEKLDNGADSGIDIKHVSQIYYIFYSSINGCDTRNAFKQ
jgi:hypothetical protein